MSEILLGYETGTGKAVSIPLAHTAVVGQTQLSGKTTTLEALIERGELRAVAFITKPGEKSFGDAPRILPYFRERADWEYVKQLLEARRGESLSKWDGYLMRVCRGAKTLADVRDNVEAELPKKRTARPTHYETLAGYLDLLVPELERVPYSDSLKIPRGINVMDLSELSDEMQSMVLRSTIERIHQHERNTVLVLPEAWKFVPEGERSAVFDALHVFIREGATNGNFLWIDAQDIAVVSKRILKSVSVWILGRQNEANEVARTINHLIEPMAIRSDMIKTLGIGQFLVCAGGAARKVYVMPKWLGALDAQAIARGEESIETARRIFEQKRAAMKSAAFVPHASSASFRGGRPDAGDRARETVEQRPIEPLPPKPIPAPPQLLQLQIQEIPDHEENAANPGQSRVVSPTSQAHTEGSVGSALDAGGADVDQPEDEMYKQQFEELTETHRALIQVHDAMVGRVQQLIEAMEKAGIKIPPPSIRDIPPGASGKTLGTAGYYEFTGKGWSEAARATEHGAPVTLPASGQAGNGSLGLSLTVPQLDYIYRYVTARAEKDPAVLRVITSRPEIQVHVTAKTLEVDESEPTGAIALLIHEKFFDGDGKNGNAVCKELIDRRKLGFARRTLYDNLETVARMGFLVHEGKLYRATGRKVTVARGA